jgi:hypothetical protein
MKSLRLIEIGYDEYDKHPYEIIGDDIDLTDYAEDFLKEEGVTIEFNDLEEGITEYGQDYQFLSAVITEIDGDNGRHYEEGEEYHFYATRLRTVGL